MERLPRCEFSVDCSDGGEVGSRDIRCCGVCRDHYSAVVSKRLAGVDERVKERVLTALCALTCAVRSYGPGHVAFSFNGGKDCTVILYLLELMDPTLIQQLAVTVHFRPRDVFPEMEDFLRSSQKRHGFTLWECACRDNKGDGRCSPIAVCLSKTLHAFPAVRAVLLGTRNSDFTDERLRHESCFALTDVERGWPRVMRVSPIIDWEYDDVWQFLRGFSSSTKPDERWCKLYDAGYTSLGSVSDSRPNPALYNEQTKGYKPAWMLHDPQLERESRIPKYIVSPSVSPSISPSPSLPLSQSS